MTKLELIILISLIIFDVGYIVIAPFFYARRWGQTYVETCKEIYGAMLAGVPDAFRSFLKWCITLPALLKKFVARCYVPFCIWLESQRRLRRPRFQWGYDCECEVREVLTDYAYNKFEPYVNVHSGFPGVIQIQYITQKTATDEEVQACMEHIVSKIRHYMTAYGVSFPIFPYYMIDGSTVSIFILYCEYEQELPDFYKTIHTVIMTKTAGSFGTLKECHIPKRNSDEIILGYSASKWNDGGIVSPFVWSYKKDPHLLIAGTTGGGKTVLAQLLVKQLLTRSANLTILDYKAGGDWDGIVPQYAEFKACDEMFDRFYQSFVETIEKKAYNENFLLIDELSAWVGTKDNKEKKIFMDKLGHIAFMGRSFGYHLIYIGQQLNAQVVDTSIREQANTKIFVGNRISTESATMLFPNTQIDKSIRLPNYHGYITTPDTDLDTIVIPELANPQQLKKDLQALGQKYYD